MDLQAKKFSRIFPGGKSRIFTIVFLIAACLLVAGISFGQDTGGVEWVNPLDSSTEMCVVCHKMTTPGIIEQYGHSTMAAAGVGCGACHEVEAGYPGSVEHNGSSILANPTPKMCAKCHPENVDGYTASRHAAPAWAAMRGLEDFTDEQIASYEAVEEVAEANWHGERNAIYHMEGPEITRFACVGCHSIGRPREDGSIGECQQCHLRHEFSLEQARKPETCNACHIGPDHPQYEIYTESPHGIAYHTMGHNWDWDADSGDLGVGNFPAPTCATCHMSGFGEVAGTHDVGDRLTWYLFAPISTRRPHYEENRDQMQAICFECHNTNFINEFYTDGDAVVERVNELVLESRAIIAPAQEAGLITSEPFDQPIDYLFFDIWHHWGRTTKFGSWMQGPDYTQWHGAYEMFRDISELRERVDELMEDHAEGE